MTVRPRENHEQGKGDTCRCGLPFMYVVIQEGKETQFYWCSRCDSNLR